MASFDAERVATASSLTFTRPSCLTFCMPGLTLYAIRVLSATGQELCQSAMRTRSSDIKNVSTRRLQARPSPNLERHVHLFSTLRQTRQSVSQVATKFQHMKYLRVSIPLDSDLPYSSQSAHACTQHHYHPGKQCPEHCPVACHQCLRA